MKEIKCPKCGTVFKIDENDYNEILEQVKGEAFAKEIERNKKEAEEKYLERLNAEKAKLISENEKRVAELLHQKELLEKTKEDEVKKAVSEKDIKIAELQGKVDNAEMKAKNMVNEALEKERKAREDLRIEKEKLMTEFESEKTQFAKELKAKDEQVAFYKDFKIGLTVKEIGESLEVYCHNKFDEIRAIAYPRAYFEKDNEVIEGTKGDFVFRDYDENGTEFVSIMFEMKNEEDETATKHKNEAFFKKLDEDRKKKGCTYAVLVSMLEPENNLYNNGIVDVSHRYENMFVVRPQFFLPIIALLDSTSKKNSKALALIEEERKRNIDVTNFENKLTEFQNAFGKNYDLATRQFNEAIEEIDKTIAHLQKVRDNLTKSGNNLRLANDKAQALSIKKLTKDSPTLKAKFEAIDSEDK